MFDEQPDGYPHGECAAEIHRLEGVIRRAANIMRGGEGVEDQGEAWDRVQRLLDETVADMTPNVEVSGADRRPLDCRVRHRRFRMRETRCPFCGHDPFHYVDIGVGYQAAAVNCCDLGVDLFQYGTKKARKLAALKSSPSPRKQARFKRLMTEYWREQYGA